MRLDIISLALFLSFTSVNAQTAVDKCPKTEYACLDVINSSLCISQNAAQGATAVGAKQALVNCVVYEGAASDLPGATKLCRCTGCHSTPVNAVLEELFPAPCS